MPGPLCDMPGCTNSFNAKCDGCGGVFCYRHISRYPEDLPSFWIDDYDKDDMPVYKSRVQLMDRWRCDRCLSGEPSSAEETPISDVPVPIEEHRQLQGDRIIGHDLRLYGAIMGTATISSSATLDVFGMVGKDLVLLPGSHANVYGLVAGTIWNQGGTLQVFGIVGQRVLTSDGGQTYVDPNAHAHRD